MGCNTSLSSEGAGVEVDPGEGVRRAAREAQSTVRSVEQVLFCLKV